MRIPMKIQYKDYAANLVTAEFNNGPDAPNVCFRNADTNRILLNPVMSITTWWEFVDNLSQDKESDMIILIEKIINLKGD